MGLYKETNAFTREGKCVCLIPCIWSVLYKMSQDINSYVEARSRALGQLCMLCALLLKRMTVKQKKDPQSSWLHFHLKDMALPYTRGHSMMHSPSAMAGFLRECQQRMHVVQNFIFTMLSPVPKVGSLESNIIMSKIWWHLSSMKCHNEPDLR